jgi:hypothetical protein
MSVARTVPRGLRDPFLRAVADELRGKPIGDGSVHRAALKASMISAKTSQITAAAAGSRSTHR